VGVTDRLLAQLAANEDGMHAGVERARTEQGVARYQVVEAVALHGPQGLGGQRRLELEDPRRPPTPEQLVDRRIIEGEGRHVRRGPVPLGDHGHRVVDHGERLQAQHVHLQHADLLQRAHLVLRDDRLFAAGAGSLGGRGAHRHVLPQGTRRDHNAGGVHGQVAGDSLDPAGQVGQALVDGIRPDQFAELIDLLQRLRDGQGVRGPGRDQLGELVRLPRRHLEDPGHVLDRGPGLHGAEGDDLAHRVPAVLLPDVLDHLASAFEAEVDVDVGHRNPFGIEEPLEEQVETERIDVCDPEGVRNHRPGGRASPGSDWNVIVARKSYEVRNNQEVPAVSRFPDDVQFELESVPHMRGKCLVPAATACAIRLWRAITRDCALPGQEFEVVLLAGTCRWQLRECRQKVPLLEIELAPVRHLLGVGERVGQLREELPHFTLRLDV